MATMKDVAKLAGVSASTVSIVINNKSQERSIPEETVKKVNAAIRALGYRPNLAAQRLRGVSMVKLIIALYWPIDMRSYSMGWVLRCIQEELQALYFDCDLMVRTYKSGHLSEVVELTDNCRFDGAIIGGVSREERGYLESIKPKIPIVFFNRDSKKYNSVCGDDRALARGVAELFSRCGHTEAAVFTAGANYAATESRLRHFAEQCDAFGMRLKTEHIIQTQDTMEGGVQAARLLLTQEMHPRAIFCMTDSLAIGAVYELNQRGKRIPEEYSVIANALFFPEFTQYNTPAITVATVSIRKLATECTRILVNQLTNYTTKAVHQVIEPEFFLRDSCSPPK